MREGLCCSFGSGRNGVGVGAQLNYMNIASKLHKTEMIKPSTAKSPARGLVRAGDSGVTG